MPQKRVKKTSAKSKNRRAEDYKRLFIDFMNSIPDVVYMKDIKGRLTFVNLAHANGLDLKPDEVIGKTDFDIFPKDRAAKMQKDDNLVMKDGKSIIDKIERATRADGIDNYVSTTKIPRYDEKGKIIGLIGITRDVTKRVKMEKQKQDRISVEKKLEMLEDMNNLKSEFISTVSHELRTPLAIIKQLLSLVFDETAGPVNDNQREILVKVRNNIERLKRMLDELLDISSIEEKKLKLRYSLANLNHLIEDSQDYYKELASEKSIRLSYHLPSEDISLFIDVERIIQVITNLINNAIKFTEENGKIKVEVKVLETKVRIGVIDTGIGISKQNVTKIFEKFTQLLDGDEKERAGIGLGLSVVKDLVDKHGGEVWVESKLGVGSKFYFTLPRFYTANILEASTRTKINNLLKNQRSVCLINLLIVHFDDFKKRINQSPQKVTKDLKTIINNVIVEFDGDKSQDYEILTTNLHKGKFSIIFPEADDKRVSAFSELLRKQTKEYFVKHRLEDIFIALGIMSYDVGEALEQKTKLPTNFNIKEIYIGSEMRRYKRINYKTDIEIELPNGNKLQATSIDISQVGIALVVKEPLSADDEVEVKISLIKKKINIRAVARAAWVCKMDRLPGESVEMYKVGLEFIGLKSKDRKTLFSELRLYYE